MPGKFLAQDSKGNDWQQQRFHELRDQIIKKNPKAWQIFFFTEILARHEVLTGTTITALSPEKVSVILKMRLEDNAFCATALSDGLELLVERGFQDSDLGTHKIPILQYLADIGRLPSDPQ